MIYCDKCQANQEASHRVGIVLCDKCYKQFMTLFGTFEGAKSPPPNKFEINTPPRRKLHVTV